MAGFDVDNYLSDFSVAQVVTIIVVASFAAFLIVGINSGNKVAEISIDTPLNESHFSDSSIRISGTVDPEETSISVGDGPELQPVDGKFTFKALLPDSANVFRFNAWKGTKIVHTKTVTIYRDFSEAELRQRERDRILIAKNLADLAKKQAKAEREDLAKWERSKAGRIQKKHPEWSRFDCERLADGSIWIGMHVNMLKYRWGLPNSANPSNYGNGTQWQWCWHDYTPSCYYDNNDDGLIDSYN